MAIEIKTIACPQCGSTDVQMTSEAKGVCCCCGAQFTVRQGADTQNVYNEVHVYADGNSAEKEIPAAKWRSLRSIQRSVYPKGMDHFGC